MRGKSGCRLRYSPYLRGFWPPSTFPETLDKDGMSTINSPDLTMSERIAIRKSGCVALAL